MPGETEHAKGKEGTDSAKRWLERTTRAQVQWVQPDEMAVRKLTFKKANGSSFSFDIGGLLRGGELSNAEFLGEVKKYKDASDQPDLYKEFLAKCYRAYDVLPERCDRFIWITWAPFSATTWSKLDDPDRIKNAVLEHWEYNFETTDERDSAVIDDSLLGEVSNRIWRVVLSDNQIKHLSMSDEYRAVIAKHEVERGTLA